eukprot:scaffold9347_cov135-Skeletonema_marinoi.AAC.5
MKANEDAVLPENYRPPDLPPLRQPPSFAGSGDVHSRHDIKTTTKRYYTHVEGRVLSKSLANCFDKYLLN